MSDTLERLKSALAARYAVEREVGAGGMAVVYLARDLKHDRQVAIKVLRPEVASSVGPERFLREIQVAAKLSHPHILPLYDSGEADGFLYYVMPFVEGESLEERLDHEHQLPLEEALRIAVEVADALGYAHQHGLVHRDIKPGNIMLSGGHALVMDFGICRALDAAGADRLTKTATSMGTPTYMAPEQWDEAKEADGRADIYSLGCTLYEMLVGQPPFTGTTLAAIMARHSMEAVPKPSIQRDAIHPHLESVIIKALSKTPADRYATAALLAKDLEKSTRVALGLETLPALPGGLGSRPWSRPSRKVAVGAAAGALGVLAASWIGFEVVGGLQGPRSATSADSGYDLSRVAVLYFDDASTAGGSEFLADAFTESLIEQLQSVPGLDVVSRNGVLPFRGEDVPYDSVGRALQAGTVIDGSVEEDEGRIRINVRLVDGASGVDLERAALEFDSEQAFEALDDVATEVSRLFREALGQEVRLRTVSRGTQSLDAWRLYQRGEQTFKGAEDYVEAQDMDGFLAAHARADSLLALAEELDPGWVEPSARRGDVAFAWAQMIADPEERASVLETGLQQAEHAVSVGPTHARARQARGSLRYLAWLLRTEFNPAAHDALLDGARADLERASQLDPSLASAFALLSHLYSQPGIEDPSLSALAARRAYEADRYLTSADDIVHQLFMTTLNGEQFATARGWCQEGSSRFPDDPRFEECRLWLMVTPGASPNVEEAWRIVDEIDSHSSDPARDLTAIRARMLAAGALARAELTDSARAVLQRAHEAYRAVEDPTQETMGVEAMVWILLGEADHAIDLIKEYAVAQHGFVRGGNVVWWWRDLQDHPRFNEIVTDDVGS